MATFRLRFLYKFFSTPEHYFSAKNYSSEYFQQITQISGAQPLDLNFSFSYYVFVNLKCHYSLRQCYLHSFLLVFHPQIAG